MTKIKDNTLDKILILLFLLYSFFLSRRGGSAKDTVALLVMGGVLFYSYKNGIEKYLEYKKEIFISILYLILVTISYIIEVNKEGDKFYVFTHATLYSIGFMIVLINYKLDNAYVKFIFPLLIFFSLPPMYRGFKDIYLNFDAVTSFVYRIRGGTYTTHYAEELGIYLLIGIFALLYYKKIYLKFIFLIHIFANLILIFATQSRNTFLVIPVTIISILILMNWKKGIIISLIFIASLGLLFKYSHKIANINRIKNSISTVEKIKQDARYGLFTQGINEARDTIIVGRGFYHFKEKTIERPNQNLESFHNNLIETAVTQGVVTLVVYVIFLITIFVRLAKNYFKEEDRNKKYIRLLATAIFIFSNLYGLFETAFYSEKIYQLTFTIFALSFILDKKSNTLKF